MGTNCAPLVADLFLFCYEVCQIGESGWHYRGIQFHFKIPSGLINIDNIYFEQMVNRIYSAELQLIKLILLILKRRFDLMTAST